MSVALVNGIAEWIAAKSREHMQFLKDCGVALTVDELRFERSGTRACARNYVRDLAQFFRDNGPDCAFLPLEPIVSLVGAEYLSAVGVKGAGDR